MHKHSKKCPQVWWNHRVMKKTINGHVCFGIVEVHYRRRGTKVKIEAWTDDFMTGAYESAKDVYADLDMFEKAFSKKLLIEDEKENVTEGTIAIIN